MAMVNGMEMFRVAGDIEDNDGVGGAMHGSSGRCVH